MRIEAHIFPLRIKPKLDELGSLHARHLLRPSLDDKCEEEELIENLSQHISKLISSTHRHIQYIRSSLGQGTGPSEFFSFYMNRYSIFCMRFRQKTGAKIDG